MATVRAFQIEGLKVWFWSHDHEPPHFHAKRAGEWEVRVHFLTQRSEMIEYVWAEKQPSSSVLKNLTAFAEEHRAELIAALIYRLFSGMAHADGPKPIVDAWVDGDNLMLLSPAFTRLAVPLKKLSKLLGTKLEEIEAFEIDEDGRFLFWPHADVHLGWEQFLQIVDPAAALAAKQKSQAFNERYGAAIRALREEHGLKQSDIAGIAERHLRRVEHGEQAASKGTLEALAKAHGRALGDYLKELAARSRKTA